MSNNTNRLSVFLHGMVLLLGCCGAADAATPQVATGNQYAIALKADGNLTTWGRNDLGQLGNGQAAMRVTPAKVDGIDRITSVIAGNSFTLALRDDGTVWGWGANTSSQLGDGTTQSKSHPVQVTGLSGAVKSVAASYWHALAVTADSSVWAWGYGGDGQLGSGGIGNRTSAAKVAGLPAVSKVATGAYHSLALASDGTVWAWGDNSQGQLGDGTTTSRLTPIRVNALSNIVAISTKASSNLALDAQGRVWAWGNGGWGALGSGSYSNRTTPFIVQGLPQIAAIAAGNRVSVATAADGSVWMWGNNETGQFGDIKYTNQPSPVKVSALAGLNGFSIGEGHATARGSGGALYAWGENGYGQLGVGDSNDRSAPAPVNAPAQFEQVSAGANHTAAAASDGSVWTWGSNGSGELADGTVSASNKPVAVQGPNDITAVAAGYFHVLALGGDGSVWAWGQNGDGALGDGSRHDSTLPQRVPALPVMSAIAAGKSFSLALEQNGAVWSWGRGSEGGLGNGQGYTQLTPKKLTTVSGVTQLSAKYEHVLAMRQDGSVWAWGSNDYGQLGDGTATNRSTPVRVTGLPGAVTAVAAGIFHSLALDISGNVWAWGNNCCGQLGDGTSTSRRTPVRVANLSDAVAISAGSNVSYAITRDGRLWAWGWNREGELGTGASDRYSLLARPIEELADFREVAGGSGSAVALRQDGTVWAWGRNFEGQLGDATFAQRNTPVLTVNAAVDGPLDLDPQVADNIPANRIPPFFATTYRAGDLSRLTVGTTTKFGATDLGKPGAVYVTAIVPQGSPLALSAGAPRATALAASAAGSFIQIQLTPTGWQQVVGGQLMPYASGTLGDMLAAQNILVGQDTTNLGGAQFCVGYGTSAAEMIATGKMRVVATIPVDPDATDAPAVSCIVEGGTAPNNQTIGAISFSPTTLAVGGATTASATATSGLAVTFTSTTPAVCTVSGSTVTAIAAGTCTIAADQPGNASYNPTARVTQNITVGGAAQTATASEFYHAGINHYFMTASTEEAAYLDNKPDWGWARTGKTFNIWLTRASAPGNASPVCRFFGVFSNGTVGSHFYTVDAAECDMVKGRLDWGWGYENDAFYAVNPVGGACPGGTAPVYRVFNNGMGGAPNHRYMASQADLNTMLAQGWVSEGIAFCGAQ